MSGNILDLVITHRVSSIITSSVKSTSLLTDHHVVECHITVSKPASLKRRVDYRKYSSIDKRAFATDIVGAFAADPGTNDELIDMYNITIATVLNKHAPIVSRIITVRPKTPWHTEDLSKAKRDLRCAERRWKKTRLVVHRQIFTTLRHAYHHQLAATKSTHYRMIIHEAVNNVKAMYSVTNDLLGRSASPRLPDCRDDATLAEEFHQYFTQKIGNIRSTTDSRSITNTRDPLPPTAYHPAELCEFQPASADDVRRIIVQFSSKSCELYPMPTNLLKDNIDTLAPIITDIVNNSLQSGVAPAAMKHAIVTPIMKKRGLDANSYMNYRPISSLSVVSKTVERYGALELHRFLDDKCLIDPFQSAYRPGHSTETALVKIHNDVLLSIDSRRSVLLVLLDLSAAFDTLDHTILLHRLRELGLDGTVIEWFTSYLIGRSNSVKIRQTTSSRQTIKYGVPQGSVLGPIMFNIYISPIADIFRRHQIRYHIYADDTQLYAECPPSNHTDALRRLRDCVDDLKRWLDRNHLLLNESKTEAIVFRSAAVRVTSVESTVDDCGAVVPLLPTIRDFGVILDNGLDMSAQVSNACRGAYFHLFRIAKIRKCLNTAACKTLVHSLVTSRIDYGKQVLYGISDRLLHRLDMVQRSAARVVLRIRHGDRQSMTAALKQLHWLPVKWRVEYKLLVLVFRALHDQTLAYLASLITPYVPSRALRSAGQALLTVPRHNLERYGRRSFSCAGPTLWNALLEDIRMTVNINAFKAQLKTHYFKVAFN